MEQMRQQSCTTSVKDRACNYCLSFCNHKPQVPYCWQWETMMHMLICTHSILHPTVTFQNDYVCSLCNSYESKTMYVLYV